MADPHGFMKFPREEAAHRPVPLRLMDWKEVYEPFADSKVQTQASRCMDCGIPFCHDGCPLGNIIPEWNDLVRQGRWKEAYDRLHATNNFPEFTGRICPAPCEGACVLGIEGIGAGAGVGDPVAIKTVELQIVEHAFEEGWVRPVKASFSTGQSVAVVGSGPAGLAAAQQLTRAGHDVTVFERDDRIGGLLRYGVPDYKLENRWIDRRLVQMEAEGTTFRTGVSPSTTDLAGFDAVVMAVGATVPRDVSLPGRNLDGVHQAMEYLPMANRVVAGDIDTPEIDANGKHVVIIGGGDTGTDCFGTALRQGAASVRQFDYHPAPDPYRAEDNPWPVWPKIWRVASAHEEGEYHISGDESADEIVALGLAEREVGTPLGKREHRINTVELTGEDGRVTSLRAATCDRTAEGTVNLPGTEVDMDADLVLLAVGFTSVDTRGIISELGLPVDGRGRLKRDDNYRTWWAESSAVRDTGFDAPVFATGDAGRGASLIVWAISEGRACAAAVDRALMGESALPRPVAPSDMPLSV
ncbi:MULTISPECIES: glutamate synthase subunit beta [unclassified Corynebacterium]|uniref:glutamate synthase subunit beta n=1 Tax=unclassified Corynebacterium TaxID=2624378 RepID=UPI0026499370|nr:glutamate synthase subunit beta [Corynebacterium sp.]MDN5581801.1 glutamate synthase subunit beta [Corynebacterium sp.]MDN5719179.1 glutamate synthase subunit beta [Corynebacterium sp.]MDN6386584.1 glutamate synthase subunit beta [Corynebacterium sp.]MDN6509306.1 glutamate synthase subunit beta [Corynebacterium sp.]